LLLEDFLGLSNAANIILAFFLYSLDDELSLDELL
jgi:hypothetical protein